MSLAEIKVLYPSLFSCDISFIRQILKEPSVILYKLQENPTNSRPYLLSSKIKRSQLTSITGQTYSRGQPLS